MLSLYHKFRNISILSSQYQRVKTCILRNRLIMSSASGASITHPLLVHNATQVVQVVCNGERVVVGEHMTRLAILDRTEKDGISIVVGGDGKIIAIGFDTDVKVKYQGCTFEKVIDATNKCVIPGFVDAHTHTVWLGDRVNEFSMKLAGATYLDIHAAGGGINFTVGHVQAASEDDLFEAFKVYARRMIAAGTTLLECKTGYGLTLEAELKMLRVLKRVRDESSLGLDVSITYCAAHAIPKGLTAEQATSDIVSNQIPKIHALMCTGELDVDNIDVFCEKGVYDVTQSRQILEAGQQIGLKINFHGEELSCLHSAEMGAELKATAISHLEEVSSDGIRAMADAGTIAVLLPTTAYILRLPPPPARDMITAGVAVALGSDFNPNAHCLAMPVVMHLACVLLHLSMAEALIASTINAAASLNMSDQHGSLECGKLGNMIILDAPRWEHIIYQFGGHHDVISYVIAKGQVLYKK